MTPPADLIRAELPIVSQKNEPRGDVSKDYVEKDSNKENNNKKNYNNDVIPCPLSFKYCGLRDPTCHAVLASDVTRSTCVVSQSSVFLKAIY